MAGCESYPVAAIDPNGLQQKYHLPAKKEPEKLRFNLKVKSWHKKYLQATWCWSIGAIEYQGHLSHTWALSGFEIDKS